MDMFSMHVAKTKALAAYEKHKQDVKNHKHMLVVDFMAPSYRKRAAIIDLSSMAIIRMHHVAHGTKSCSPELPEHTKWFSNTIGSRKSSRGSMISGDVYYGKHGRSLRLHGLEKGINSNVYLRSIVIHSAEYVTDKYIIANGAAGCSWGCFAFDPAVCSNVIDLIKDGSFVYAYGSSSY